MQLRLLLVALVTIFASGCAIGTTRLTVGHAPLDKVAQKGKGTILVKQFVDKRKWGKWGRPLDIYI